MSKKIEYISIMSAVFVMFAIMSIMLSSVLSIPKISTSVAVILAAFYIMLNVMSFQFHDLIKKSNEKMLTSFFICDKVVRFISCAVLTGVLLYINKSVSVVFIAFAYYLAAMTIEICYFIADSKKTEARNA